ncbi:hypothetical protein ACVXG7_08730 [Enterobacter hormaechei]
MVLWLGRLTGRLDYAAGFCLCAAWARRADRDRTGAQRPAAGGEYSPAREPAGTGAAPGEPAEKMRRHQRSTPNESCATADVPQAMKPCLVRC